MQVLIYFTNQLLFLQAKMLVILILVVKVELY